MSKLRRALMQATAGADAGAASADVVDDEFHNVVLRIDGDGTDGSDNGTFTDSSSNSRTITASSVAQGTFSPFAQVRDSVLDGKWSRYFAAADYDTWGSGSNYEIGNADFTVEFYANGTANGTNVLVAKGTTGSVGSSSWWFETVSGTMKFYISNGSTYTVLSDDQVFRLYEGWVHIAYVNDSGTSKLYMNGVLKDSTTTPSTNSSTAVVSVGASNVGTFTYEGFISNLRISKSADFTGTSFDVPTTQRRGSSGKLWAYYGNNYDSVFTSHGGPTINGTTSGFYPFSRLYPDTNRRTLADDGGSAHFSINDSSYLSYSGGPSTVSDITVSFWFYVDDSMGINSSLYPRIFASASNAFLIYLRDDDIRIYNGGEKVQTPIKRGEWHRFAAQRSSGTWTMYLDGVSVGTASDSTNINLNTINYIGRDTTASGYFGGYLKDFRITTSGSTDVSYSSDYGALVDDTELLLKFEDANIVDISGQNNLVTVNGSTISTSAQKYGTGSLFFDGSNDRIDIPHSPVLDFIEANFTIEFWLSLNPGTGDNDGIISKGNSGSGWQIIWNDTNELLFIRTSQTASSALLNSGNGTVSRDNTWHHVAVTRSGSTVRMFLDGTLVDSATESVDMDTTEPLRIATNRGESNFFEGYLDDLRITKGVARYTSNFTPPTQALGVF